jgi:hypothetical protein
LVKNFWSQISAIIFFSREKDLINDINMALSRLPDAILNHEIAPYLTFTESINLRKTAKSFNESYIYQHDPRLDLQLAIAKASSEGKLDAVRCLLKVPFIDPGFNYNYAVRITALKGHVEIMQELLTNRLVDPADFNNEAIINAASHGHSDIVKMLLKDNR